MSSNFKIKKNTSNSRLLVHLALNEPFAILVQKSISMQRNANNNFPINFWIPANKLKLADEMIKTKGKNGLLFPSNRLGFLFLKKSISRSFCQELYSIFIYLFSVSSNICFPIWSLHPTFEWVFTSKNNLTLIHKNNDDKFYHMLSTESCVIDADPVSF